ncbi:MAG: magnesium/cobalt transporter CorA [Magnetospirillum sp.]|nr:magnesium/cobalt transporter CorA [Magnetospirillum sp.]
MADNASSAANFEIKRNDFIGGEVSVIGVSPAYDNVETSRFLRSRGLPQPSPPTRCSPTRMIHSFIFSEGKLVGRDLEVEASRLVHGDKGLILWIDLDNPTDDEIKQVLEGIFQFHPLAIEDCMTPSSLPKIEDYEDYLFMVMHAVDFTRHDKFATTELDLFLGKEFVVTFHREPLRSVQTLIERLAKSASPGPRGPDRLAHSLLDLIIDNYAPLLTELHGELEEIEDTVLLQDSSKEFVSQLLDVRRDFTQLRHIVRPQRDVIDRLARGESRYIRSTLLPYFRDLRDNLARLEDAASSYHERLMMAFDIYLNKAAFEANEGIKFLTAITAITIPIMVVGTWYGMNFENMTELNSAHGYRNAFLITLVLTLLTALYLKKKRWF